MKHLKKFEKFQAAEPAVKPTTKPATKPTTRPNRPSPIRRDKPSVEPAPKALKKASAQDVINRYKDEMGISERLDTNSLQAKEVSKKLSDNLKKYNWFNSVSINGDGEELDLVVYTKKALSNEESKLIPVDFEGLSVIVKTMGDISPSQN